MGPRHKHPEEPFAACALVVADGAFLGVRQGSEPGGRLERNPRVPAATVESSECSHRRWSYSNRQFALSSGKQESSAGHTVAACKPLDEELLATQPFVGAGPSDIVVAASSWATAVAAE